MNKTLYKNKGDYMNKLLYEEFGIDWNRLNSLR